jgi:hypothetical protein
VTGGAFPQRRFTRPIELGALEVARKKLSTRLKVFLAGPYVHKDWTEEDFAKASLGARLRVEAIEILAKLEHDCVLGEHRGVEEVTSGQLPSQSSIALSELALIDEVDAIIIIPDSPGSFAELGAWALLESRCEKTLVLANQDYKNVGGYVSQGVIPMAQHNRARVEWIGYADFATAEQLIAEFISDVQDKLISRKIRGLA